MADSYTVSTPDGHGAQLLTSPSTSSPMDGMWLDEHAGVGIVCQGWSAEAVGPRSNHIFDKVSMVPLTIDNMPWIPDAYVAGTAPANQFTPGIAGL